MKPYMILIAALVGFLVVFINGEIALNQPIYRQKRPNIMDKYLRELRLMRKAEEMEVGHKI